MRYGTTMHPKEYLRHMKERMGSRLDIWSERFTGILMGRFFYVTHHAGYEWNRRITNKKNAALGYVKETENGCEIRFLHFQGVLCPQYLIPWLLISVVLLVVHDVSSAKHVYNPLPYMIAHLFCFSYNFFLKCT